MIISPRRNKKSYADITILVDMDDTIDSEISETTDEHIIFGDQSSLRVRWVSCCGKRSRR